MAEDVKKVAPKKLEDLAGEIWGLVCRNIDQVLKDCEKSVKRV